MSASHAFKIFKLDIGTYTECTAADFMTYTASVGINGGVYAEAADKSFVIDKGSRLLKAFDHESGAFAGELALEAYPEDICISEDGARLYIANDNIFVPLTVVDIATLTEVSSIERHIPVFGKISALARDGKIYFCDGALGYAFSAADFSFIGEEAVSLPAGAWRGNSAGVLEDKDGDFYYSEKSELKKRELTALAVIAPSEIKTGASADVTVIGSYSDGFTADVTASAQITSDSAAMTVAGSTVAAVSAGAVQLGAAVGGITGSAAVTVTDTEPEGANTAITVSADKSVYAGGEQISASITADRAENTVLRLTDIADKAVYTAALRLTKAEGAEKAAAAVNVPVYTSLESGTYKLKAGSVGETEITVSDAALGSLQLHTAKSSAELLGELVIYGTTKNSSSLLKISVGDKEGEQSEKVYYMRADGGEYVYPISIDDSFSAGEYYVYVTADGEDSESRSFTVEEAPRAAKPVFSQNTEVIEKDGKITLSCATDGAVIYYTTNGNDPDNSSSVYGMSIKISKSMMVKAIAYCEGMQPSEIAKQRFVVTSSSGTSSSKGNGGSGGTITVTPTQAPAASGEVWAFEDVGSGSWYYTAVKAMSDKKIINGVGDNKFAPDADIKRADFLVLAMKSFNIAPDESAADNFADAGDCYYTPYLAAAKAAGLVNGVGDNRFAPESAVTRQDMVVILYQLLENSAGLPESSGSRVLSDFSDETDIAGYAREKLLYMVNAGVINGSDAGLLPLKGTTRAEAAQVLYNITNK